MKKALFTIAPYFCPSAFATLISHAKDVDIYIIVIDHHSNIPHDLPERVKLLPMQDLTWGTLNYQYAAFGLEKTVLISALKCLGFYTLLSQNHEYEQVIFLENNRMVNLNIDVDVDKLFSDLNHYDAILIPKDSMQLSIEEMIFHGTWENYFYAFKKTPAILDFIKAWFLKSFSYGVLRYQDKTVFASDVFLNALTVYTEKVKHDDGKNLAITTQNFTKKYIYDFYEDGEKILQHDRLKYHYVHPVEKEAIGNPFSDRSKILRLQTIVGHYFWEINTLLLRQQKLDKILSSKLLQMTKPLVKKILRILRA